MKWRWVFAFAPVALGAAASVWLNSRNQSPIFYVTIDLGTVLFFLGLALSTVILAMFVSQVLIERARQETKQQASQDRR